jgi:UDPglucose 6-dehydrogenase
VREVAPLLSPTAVVVTKSMVPVGTGDEIERILLDVRPEADMHVVSNPEFLREGAAIYDFKHPDRIVIGSDNEAARAVMAEVYRPLYLNAAPLLHVSRRTAELIKYAANAFLATKITFINEIADLCERTGADVNDVARGMGLDNRIGGKFLHAGPGFGGSCFPKDATALLKTAHDHGVPLRIVETVAAVNDQRKRAMARKVVTALDGSIRGKTVAVLGLSFKPNTDDMRDSPSIPLITALHDLCAIVRGFGRDGGRQGAAPRRYLLRQRLRGRRRRRGGRHRHRMGTVPRARSRPVARGHGAAGDRRSAQHLPRRGANESAATSPSSRSRREPKSEQL